MWRHVRVLAAGLLLATAVVPATASPAAAAVPSLTISTAEPLSSLEIHIGGLAVCGSPTGPVTVEISAIEVVGGTATGSAATTVGCGGSGQVPWELTVSSWPRTWSEGSRVRILGTLIRNGSSEATTYAEFDSR